MIQLLVLLAGLSLNAIADEEASSARTIHYGLGHSKISGSFFIDITRFDSTTSPANNSTEISLSATYQRFVADRLALGGAIAFSTDSTSPRTTRWSIAPALTIPIAVGASDVWSVSQFLYLHSYSSAGNSSKYIRSATTVGWEYFLNSSIAFGPRLFFVHRFQTNAFAGYNSYGIEGVFSLYL